MALKTDKVINQLNRILESELAGVVRYTHYSMMIFGYSRIPIVAWFREQAAESLAHAQQAGEMVTRFGGHPSLAIGDLLETHQHDIGGILRETLQAEHSALGLYDGLAEARRRQVGGARRIRARSHCAGRGAYRRDRQDAAQARRHGHQQGSARSRLTDCGNQSVDVQHHTGGVSHERRSSHCGYPQARRRGHLVHLPAESADGVRGRRRHSPDRRSPGARRRCDGRCDGAHDLRRQSRRVLLPARARASRTRSAPSRRHTPKACRSSSLPAARRAASTT